MRAGIFCTFVHNDLWSLLGLFQTCYTCHEYVTCGYLMNSAKILHKTHGIAVLLAVQHLGSFQKLSNPNLKQISVA